MKIMCNCLLRERESMCVCVCVCVLVSYLVFYKYLTFTVHTRVVPKVMSNIFLHANWEKQTKESAAVDGTSCCVILDCLVTSIACIT